MTDALMSLRDVLKVIPVGKTSWYLGVKEGRFPASIKLGLRRVAWRRSDIERLIAGDQK